MIKIGQNTRVDVESETLLHGHFAKLQHIPFGIIVSGIYGGLAEDEEEE